MGLTDILLIILSVLVLAMIVVLIITRKKDGEKGAEDRLAQRIDKQGELTARLMAGMNASHKADTEAMRASVDGRLRLIQQENARRLEDMRRTVDERLSRSVSSSIEGSFKTVSGQLERVSQSIGELKGMSGDIVDLKRILGGVKQRGNWGEAQLESILADMLPPEAYFAQYSIDGSRERVDFAVKLPGEEGVLPIDSKFPMERYAAVLNAAEQGDPAGVKAAEDALKRAVTEQAKSIRKYIIPPKTTDFAVMFIPSEAIYAHVCSLGMTGELMRSCGILTAGPATMAALISTIDMGCVKFAVEEKSAHILALLKSSAKELEKLAAHAAQAERNAQLTVTHISNMRKTADRLIGELDDAQKL